ncbi:unnamed protein product [Prorocentrum cordatum]|uniref:CUB domain-containing protein n=1 Tax=Prorocentrum cordatum TaxID=2364126 RepID=A0ABN9WW66_9DINO|nr:unnamed protein product [Polarella glacialis]
MVRRPGGLVELSALVATVASTPAGKPLTPAPAPTASPIRSPMPSQMPSLRTGPAPTFPTPASDAACMWASIIGECSLHGVCVQSPNYPQSYGVDQTCTLEISTAFSAPLAVDFFGTEAYFDTLTVNGVQHSGARGPSGMIPTTSISWVSDHSVPGSGWRLCQASSQVQPRTSAFTTSDGQFQLVLATEQVSCCQNSPTSSVSSTQSGAVLLWPCVYSAAQGSWADNCGGGHTRTFQEWIDGCFESTMTDRICIDSQTYVYVQVAPTPSPVAQEYSMWAAVTGYCTLDGSCVESHNFPQNYNNNQGCILEISAEFSAPIIVESFNTEASFDYLTVNGQLYSGSAGPSGITPTSSISWTSDHTITQSGWRLCAAPPTPAPPIHASSNTFSVVLHFDPCKHFRLRVPVVS